LAGTVGLSRAACTSLDRRRGGRGGGGPCRGPFGHPPPGPDLRPSLPLPHAALPLPCDCPVGDLYPRPFGCISPAIGTAKVAHGTYAPRGGHRRRKCGP